MAKAKQPLQISRQVMIVGQATCIIHLSMVVGSWKAARWPFLKEAY